MATKREQALAALYARLATIGGGVMVKRNEVVDQAIPAAGLVVVRDGDPGEPEVYLSPLTYAWRHRADVEAFVQKAPPGTAASALDALLASIASALYADRTLGGAVDHLECEAPQIVDEEVEGAAAVRAARIPVILHYDSTDPLA